jgi:hypothetical protein
MREHRARHLPRAHQQIAAIFAGNPRWDRICAGDIVASQEKHGSLMKHWVAAERYGPWHCSN